MSKYFDCKIKYRKIDGNGVQKVTTESYIIDALTFSEAEANIQKEMSAYISEEFKVTNIKVANYSEIIKDDLFGILVEPNNLEALIAAILKSIEDGGKKIEKQERVFPFSLEKMIKEYENLYVK